MTTLKKVWHFIWKSDSFLSWLVNLVLAFILVKFIIYPVIGLLLSTSFPLVAVVSNSMIHEPSSFDDWWGLNKEYYTEKNISEETFKEFPFKKGFRKGDIMILHGVAPKNIKTGDIIVYENNFNQNPIIHRVIKVNYEDGTYTFVTKGDNNAHEDPKIVTEEQVKNTGRAIFKLPWLGYVKIWFTKILN